MNETTTGPTDLRYARVLTVAGSDSGGGAGLQADLKTCAALGCYGMAAVTAVTVQNTLGVQAVHGVPPETVAAQIDAVLEDIGADVVKIGMLHSAAIVRAVAAALRRHRARAVVLDTVLASSSGQPLLAADAQAVLVQELFPLATVVTPNLDEAGLLLGRPVEGADAMVQAAEDLCALGAPAVLLKGGHLKGQEIVDVLVRPGQPPLRLASTRIVSGNLHGTGCTLASAIAAHLALGHGLDEAVTRARAYVLAAIRSGATVRTGQGRGPLNHGHAPQATQVLAGRR